MLNVGLLSAALLLALVGQALLWLEQSIWAALACYVIAAALFVLPRQKDEQHRSPVLAALRPFQIPSAGTARFRQLLPAALLATASLTTVAIGLRSFAINADSPRGWAAFLAGMALLVAAGYALNALHEMPARSHKTRWPRTPRSLAIPILLLLTLGVAAFLRLYQLGSLPYGLWYDEAIHGLIALDMIGQSEYRPIFIAQVLAIPSPIVYIQALSISVFGQDMVALRLPSAILGVLTVALFFLLLRYMFNGWLALLGAFLMAVSFWFILWGRSAMPGVTPPLVTVLAVLLLFRAMRSGMIIDYLWAGLALGAGAWFYTPLRLFPLVIGIFALSLLVNHRPLVRRLWPAVAVYIVAAFLLATPVLEFGLLHRDAFTHRSDQVNLFKDKPLNEEMKDLAANIGVYMLMFNREGDLNGRHNLQGRPMLNFLVGTLAVLGLSVSLANVRRPVYLLLVAWFLVMLLPGILTLRMEAPQSLRATGTIPVAYIFALVAIARLWQAFRHLPSPWPRHGAIGAIAVVAVFSAYQGYSTYFNDYAHSSHATYSFLPRQTYMAHTLGEVDTSRVAAYASPSDELPTIIRYLQPGASTPTTLEDPAHLPVDAQHNAAILFIDPRNHALLDRAYSCYPEADVSTFDNPEPDELPILVVFRLESRDLTQAPAHCN